jgi:hypothetical protein
MESSEIHTKRVCVICGSDKTYVDKHGYSHWRNHEDKIYCKNCYGRLIDSPKRNKEISQRVYLFLDKQLLEDKKTRTGICSKCGKKVGDKYRGWRNKEITIKQTQLHHEFYITICPWFSRIELCVACHDKIRWEEWREKRKSIPKKKHFCSRCGADETYKDKGRHLVEVWHFPNGERLCHKCWRNTINLPAARNRKKKLKSQGTL